MNLRQIVDDMASASLGRPPIEGREHNHKMQAWKEDQTKAHPAKGKFKIARTDNVKETKAKPGTHRKFGKQTATQYRSNAHTVHVHTESGKKHATISEFSPNASDETGAGHSVKWKVPAEKMKGFMKKRYGIDHKVDLIKK